MKNRSILYEILEELDKADDKHGPMMDPVEGWHTLMCEMQELKREMMKKNKEYTTYRKEMIQVSAMGFKLLRDCGSPEDFSKLKCDGCHV